LMRAAERGHIEVVEALLAAGVDTEKADEEGCTALITAARWGHIKVVKALLAAGADKDKLDSRSRTALAHAQGKQAIVQLLQSTD
jgi:ankyrin repeat protein